MRVPAHWKLHAAGVSACALLVGGAYQFGVRPVVEEDATAERTRQALAALSAEIDGLRATERSIREERARFEALGAGWAARRGEARTLNQQIALIAELGERHGLRVESVNAGEATRRALFDVTPISVSGEGDYPACAAFMHELIERLPDVTVEGFSVRASRAGGEKGAEFRFDCAWYADGAGSGASAVGGSG